MKTSPFEYDPVLKFSGKERDHESELDYFGARYYNHTHSRFISVDPIINKEEALYNPQIWNLYSYFRNNPVTYLNPKGSVEIRINPPILVWESSKKIQKYSPTGAGYTIPKIEPEYEIIEKNGSYKIKVTINIDLEIHIPPPGDPIYGKHGMPKNPLELFKHEWTHFQIRMNQYFPIVYKDSMAVEMIKFPSEKFAISAMKFLYYKHNVIDKMRYQILDIVLDTWKDIKKGVF
ncbi:MAG: RHS repeat-associated core domain-containing protein [Candidatus Delongbacteria bacterium]|nr:RHS repeat-associated core domain-containing protein [Candidatus Delongbacteria bacterium]